MSSGTMMKLALVLVLAVAGAAASGAIEKRITGSIKCKKDRQYHVQIETVEGSQPCGGALLNTRWVITASHCAEKRVKVKIGINADVSFFKKISISAKKFFSGPSPKYEQIIETSQQFTYKSEDDKPHDIMLIKLNEDVSAKTPMIELPPPECTKPEARAKVQIGGMGAKKAGMTNPKTKELGCAITQITECGENDKPADKYVSDESTTMCAFTPGVDICYGDAGSAVEYIGQLYGIIVSQPVDKCNGRIVMLNICHYRQWIEDTMAKHTED